jgi:hypothetical protein
MPHYYIHQRDDDAFYVDEEGIRFEDLAAAMRETHLAARELASLMVSEGKSFGDRRVELWDEHGTHIDTLLLRDEVNLN